MPQKPKTAAVRRAPRRKHQAPDRPKTIDDYLARVPTDQRAALEKLRRTIRAAAPEAVECICYGVAAFRVGGRFFVGFGATAKHCSFYLGATLQRFGDWLDGYATSKGTIRFQPESPLPASLVRKLVKARLADYAQPARKSPAANPA